MSNELILVAGGGGFIGGHLVADLRSQGKRVRAVDAKPFSEWHQVFADVENVAYDLSDLGNCHRVTDGATEVYKLAADMGGMGFIENNKALCMLSVLTSTHMLHGRARRGRRALLLLAARPAFTRPTSRPTPT